MSLPDQCPSKKEERPHRARDLARVNGHPSSPRAWRSVEEAADEPGFRDWLEREFPAGASELLEGSRRDFMKVMGASIALAGAATLPGCRRPDHKILSYSREVPEEIIPGKPLFYATSLWLPGGGSEGILCETHEGRPTKIEGNPLHPENQGRSSVWSQATILGLYDPDRLKYPIFRGKGDDRAASWDDFRLWAPDHFASFDRTQGRGLAIVADKKTSPTRDALKGELQKRWPQMRWVAYEAFDDEASREGARIAFGPSANVRRVLDLSVARVVVSFDDDVLGSSGSLKDARDFAHTRKVMGVSDPMSRLYVFESGFSATGSAADHRWRLAPSRVAAALVLLAREVLTRLKPSEGEGLLRAVERVSPGEARDFPVKTREAIGHLAADLCDQSHEDPHLGRSVVLAGASLPAEAHALALALNAVLGNLGRTMRFVEAGAEHAADSAAEIRGLAQAMARGEVDTLVTIGVNPAFDSGTDFAGGMARVRHTIALHVDPNETGARSTWQLNAAHPLESWGDALAIDGTLSPVQPMIAPLYEPALSEIEFLSLLLGEERSGYDLVRKAWRLSGVLAGSDPEKAWRRALHDGVVAGTRAREFSVGVDLARVADRLSRLELPVAPGDRSIDVVFVPGRLGDGRHANNAWLQELPAFGTSIVWDNPALMSPATAARFGLTPEPYTKQFPRGRKARVTVNGKALELAVWILPGMADDTVILTPGYGRKTCGRVGDGVGFDVWPLRGAGPYAGRGTLERVTGWHEIASTQNHWSMEGRTAIVRQVDLAAWRKHGSSVVEDPNHYGDVEKLNFAEQLGELSHTPPNISIYQNPLNKSSRDPSPGASYDKAPQWGMSIDLTTCTGCGVCTIACQAENNIPVVGKAETTKGREMAWIRVDRYFLSDGHSDEMTDPSGMVHQPVPCVHCENAPCETVCPVNATVHGPEGINYMVYNRCIGTRYCANNCPYKVRRFNFFDYGVTKFNGDYMGKNLVEGVVGKHGGASGSNDHNTINPNLIPPRLREKLDEISRMQKNPNVTVRSRGVMEKCSYCIQRINEARVESKLKGLPGVPDGFFKTACQQACPSDSIVFGDILDPASAVRTHRDNARSYLLLGYLNTRPRTTHMVRVMNPNPRIRPPVEDPFHHGGGHHDAGGDAKGGHAFNIDRRRLLTEQGYALSLRVLGAATGVMA